jgi:hypothetical protein
MYFSQLQFSGNVFSAVRMPISGDHSTKYSDGWSELPLSNLEMTRTACTTLAAGSGKEKYLQKATIRRHSCNSTPQKKRKRGILLAREFVLQIAPERTVTAVAVPHFLCCPFHLLFGLALSLLSHPAVLP